MAPIDGQKATFVFSLRRVELILKGLMVHLTSPQHCALEPSLHHWLGHVFLLPNWLLNNNKMLIMCEWPTPVGMHVSPILWLLWLPAVTNQDPEWGHLTATVPSCSLGHSPPLYSPFCEKTWMAFIKCISHAIVQLIVSSPTISGCDKIRYGILMQYRLISHYENVRMGGGHLAEINL